METLSLSDNPDRSPSGLDADAAATYASWFATLADPTRVRVLHAVATTPEGATIGGLAEQVGIAQATCSHHVKLLAQSKTVRVLRGTRQLQMLRQQQIAVAQQ